MGRYLVVNVMGSRAVGLHLMNDRELAEVYPGMLSRVAEAGLLSIVIDLDTAEVKRLWIHPEIERELAELQLIESGVFTARGVMSRLLGIEVPMDGYGFDERTGAPIAELCLASLRIPMKRFTIEVKEDKIDFRVLVNLVGEEFERALNQLRRATEAIEKLVKAAKEEESREG